ncbi:MAG: hypothetical protein AB7G88_11185, partial [Thermomicrobiales bacterium]
MSYYALDVERQAERLARTAVPGEFAERVGGPVKVVWSAAEAVAANTNGVHAAHTDDGAPEVLTTGITNPPCPRNITATAGGTAGDIKAIQVLIEGTNFLDEAISETLPAFSVDTAGTVQGE